MRTYRIQRGPNSYVFFLPSEVTRTLLELQPGEVKITIADMSAEEFVKSSPRISMPVSAHIDGLTSKHPMSTDR